MYNIKTKTMDLNEKIFELHDEGFSPSKISQKLKVKKAVVIETLGDLVNTGLGDKVAAFTEATGIDKLAEGIAEVLGADDCGCAARKESLNKLFPNKSFDDMSHETFTALKAIVEAKYTSVNTKQQAYILDVYNTIFKTKRTVSSCGTCVAKVIKQLTQIYEGIEAN